MEIQPRYLFCNKVIVLLARAIVMNRTEETTQDFGSITTSLQSIQMMSYYVIPKDTVLMFKKICNLALVPCFIFIGLLFNSFCCAMFYRMKKKSSTVILLLGLSITDILIVINAGINSLMYTSLWYGIPFTDEQQLKSIPYFAAFLSNIPAGAGNLLTLLISLERLFSVLVPMQIRRYSTSRTSVIAVILCYMLSTATCLPYMFMYTTDTVYSNTTEQFVTIVKHTSLGNNVELADALYIGIETTVRFIPVLGVAISSTITGVVVKVNARRRSMIADVNTKSKAFRQENQVTKTLLVITFVFILCQMPDTILRMYLFVDPDSTLFQYRNNMFEVASTSTYMILLINSVVNFPIYFKTSSNYNAKFKVMFGCILEREESRMSTLNNTKVTSNVSTSSFPPNN